MDLIITPDDSGTDRATGYATVPYSSDSKEETVVETTEDALSGVFQAAADGGITDLPETGYPIEAAVDEPLQYLDFLVLEDDEIVFDQSYARPSDST